MWKYRKYVWDKASSYHQLSLLQLVMSSPVSNFVVIVRNSCMFDWAVERYSDALKSIDLSTMHPACAAP